MANVTGGQASQIKRIIEEAHYPDATFRIQDRGNGRAIISVSPMPVEPIIAELHILILDMREVEHYRYYKEVFWFIWHFTGNWGWTGIAESMGWPEHTIKDRVDIMLDEAIGLMTDRMADQCLNLYETLIEERKPLEEEKKVPGRKPWWKRWDA